MKINVLYRGVNNCFERNLNYQFVFKCMISPDKLKNQNIWLIGVLLSNTIYFFNHPLNIF